MSIKYKGATSVTDGTFQNPFKGQLHCSRDKDSNDPTPTDNCIATDMCIDHSRPLAQIVKPKNGQRKIKTWLVNC